MNYMVDNYIERNKEKVDKLGKEGKELLLLICGLIKANNEELDIYFDNMIYDRIHDKE